ncbi:general substrate transporter [Atractiella rhizophila]|nr:general substrate transporter [Atractiella rhizophila]
MKPFSKPFGEDRLHGKPLVAVSLVGTCAGFLLFGYDQGIANALTGSRDFFDRFPILETNTDVQGAVLGTFVLGAAFGSFFNSFVGNRLPRRGLLWLGVLGTIFGGALQAGSVDLAMFICARIINGFTVGVLTSIVPTYMGELTKPRYRGMILALELVLGSTGLSLAFWVSYAFGYTTGPISWRIPLAIQPIIALVTLSCLCFSPESPRLLCEWERYDEAHTVLRRLYGSEDADRIVAEIREALALEREAKAANGGGSGWFGKGGCFDNNKQCFRYRTSLSITVNFFQQATGINMATYYAGPILYTVMEPRKALLVLGGLGLTGLLFCAIGCLFAIERLGRVRTMMVACFFCGVGQCMLAGGVAHLGSSSAAPYVATVGLFLFLDFFSFGWLAPGWIYGAEISALACRSRAAGLGQAATQFLWNFIVIQITPSGINNIGYKFYIPWALANFVMIPTALPLLP